MYKLTDSLLITAIAGTLISLAPAAHVQAQVLTDGVPSAAASFDTVLNLTADSTSGTSVGDPTGTLLTQINVNSNALFDLLSSPEEVHYAEVNLFDTSSVGNSFDFFNSEVNVITGSLGSITDIEASSSLNMSGGSLGSNSDVFGTANISGGTIGNAFDAEPGSNITVTGGVFDGVEIFGVADISGGTFGAVDFESSSNVIVSGGTFANNFEAFGIANISGGTFGNNFDAEAGSVVSITGGTFGSFDVLNNSMVTISGGDLGVDFNVESGAIVEITGGDFGFFVNEGTANISGGTFVASDVFLSSGDTNFMGTGFSIDGVALTGSSVTVFDGAKLTGILEDGSLIDVDLFASDPTDNSRDFFSGGLTAGGVTINIAAVPEPSSLAILALGGLGLFTRRIRS